MLTTRLLAGVFLSLVAAGFALGVGARFVRSRVEGDNGRALRRFGVWWVFLAVDTAFNQATWLAGALGVASPSLVAVLTFGALASIGVMLWGLVSYILFLFVGSARVFRVATVFYAAQVLLALALIVYLQPSGVRLTEWAGEVTYVVPPPAWAALGIALFFLLPPIVCAVAYGTLVRRTRERAARRRVLAVSVGIAGWFVGALVLGATGSGGDVRALAGFGLGIACMLAVWRAYRPWPFEEARAPARDDAALVRRVRDLV